MSNNRKKILMLVEGARTDVRLMNHLLDIYGISNRHEVVSYNTDIYTLYKEMFEDNDPDSMDILQVLRSRFDDNDKTKKMFEPVYSDILLIFDLDPQSHGFDEEKIIKMQAYFNESSDMGKLYVNYPMVESFYHMSTIPDPNYYTRTATLSERRRGEYKLRVNQENRNRDYSKFAVNKAECDIVLSQNFYKGSILYGGNKTERPDETTILLKQLEYIRKRGEVYVLCTCVYYILDYKSELVILSDDISKTR